jgi:hypothetical protein
MIADAMEKMRTSYARMAEHMPRHGEFIARSAAAAGIDPSSRT